MERRTFLKATFASAALVSVTSAKEQKSEEKILVDSMSKSLAKGDKIELDFLGDYENSNKLLSFVTSKNSEIYGVLTSANFVLLSEFLPSNVWLNKTKADKNFVYFSLKGNKNV